MLIFSRCRLKHSRSDEVETRTGELRVAAVLEYLPRLAVSLDPSCRGGLSSKSRNAAVGGLELRIGQDTGTWHERDSPARPAAAQRIGAGRSSPAFEALWSALLSFAADSMCDS